MDIGTAVFLALSAMWSIGSVAFPVWGMIQTARDYEWGMCAAMLFLGLPLGAVLAALPWMFIAEARSPDLVTLKKGYWACTASHQVTTMVLVGKVMVPQTRSECDAYGKIR